MTWAARFLPILAVGRQQEITAIAMTVWGEARGEPPTGKIAVAQVICNRMEHERQHAWEVVTKPRQFACWNEDDPTRMKLSEPLTHGTPGDWEQCVWAALGALRKWVWLPAVGTARHYLSTELSPEQWPAWARGRQPDATIGRHHFFIGVP